MEEKKTIQKGSQAKSAYSMFVKATFMPTSEKTRAHKHITIVIEQTRFESYHGMISFLKKGFLSNRIFYSRYYHNI